MLIAIYDAVSSVEGGSETRLASINPARAELGSVVGRDVVRCILEWDSGEVRVAGRNSGKRQ
jgi:hypothetical protein